MLGLSGCQTTAPEAMAQGNHTAKLLGLLEKQSAEYQRVVGTAEYALKASLTARRESIEDFRKAASLDDRARASAGDTRTESLRTKLLADADSVASDKATAAATVADFRASLDQLLTPLPSMTPALTEAQAKAAVLGTELDAETRRKELTDFIEAVGKSLKDNKDKIKQAQEDAAKVKSDIDSAAAKDAPKP